MYDIGESKRVTVVVNARPLGNGVLDAKGCESISFSISEDVRLEDALIEAAMFIKSEPIDRPDVF